MPAPQGGYAPLPIQTLPFTGGIGGPAITDVNGDGKADLLYGSQVAYGNGDGTFQQPVTLSFLASGFAGSYAVDLTGDGKADIVAINALPPLFPPPTSPVQFQVTVFRNDGSGSYSSLGTFTFNTVTFPITVGVEFNIFALSFADVNGDGRPDMITQSNFAIHGSGTDTITVLLNNGDGTFGSPANITPATDDNLGYTPLAIGDMNGDGHQDIVLNFVNNLGGPNLIPTIAVQLGNGDGTFKPPLVLTQPITAGFISDFVTLEDLNLDGHLDVVLGDGTVALGNGDGSLTLSQPLFPETPQTRVDHPLLSANLGIGPAPSLIYLGFQGNAPAVFTPQVGSSAALSLSTLSVGQHSITAAYSGDSNYAPSTSQPALVTINAASSTTSLTSSANPSYAGESVTLTAKITSSGPAPTGNVVFTAGGNALGTVPLTGGSAALSTSFSAVGQLSVTAQYVGDANTASSSASVNQAVVPAIAMSGTTNLTVKSGMSVGAALSVAGGGGFSGTVNLSCTGLPVNASCSFNPNSVIVSGSSVVSTTLTVNTQSQTSIASAALPFSIGGGGILACGFLFLWPGRRRTLAACFGSALLFVTLGLAGCGGSGSGSSTSHTAANTPPGTYTFHVLATSGSVQGTTDYTLTVQ